MPHASNEHEHAACYEDYRNTSVNKGKRTMSAQNGSVRRNNRLSALPARALGGLVPTVPIFIPADRICEERSQRDSKRKKKGHSSGSTDAVPLSAELLTRRWVRGKASWTHGSKVHTKPGWSPQLVEVSLLAVTPCCGYR